MEGTSIRDRRLYLCTSDRPDLTHFLEACMSGGVDLVQLREKSLDARPLLARAVEAAAVCADFGVPFILNDRPDLALACGAAGVHIGQDDVPAAVARAIVGPAAMVGLSTHAPIEWDSASVPGGPPVDYLSAGPVNETPTKPGRPETGLGYLEYVASTPAGSKDGIPWFVTGGVTPGTVPSMVKCGARRFVVVRYLTESSDPADAARRLRDAIDESAGW